MRHVFLIHSPITDLAARRVLGHLGVPVEEAIVLASRGNGPRAADWTVVPVEYSHDPESFPAGRIPLGAWSRLRRFDRRIARIVDGSRFHAYLPQTSQRFMRFLATHRLCEGFSLFEEGLASYRTLEAMNDASPVPPLRRRERRAYGRRLGMPLFFDPAYECAYGLQDASFPGFERRCVVGPTSGEPASDAPPGVECVLVGCGLAAHGMIDVDADLAGIEAAVRALEGRSLARVHYKLHPAVLRSDLTDRYRSVLERACAASGREATELGPNVLLEALAYESPRTLFLVSLSSVALYAGAAGAEVLCYSGAVARHDPRIVPHLEALPAAFEEAVTLL